MVRKRGARSGKRGGTLSSGPDRVQTACAQGGDAVKCVGGRPGQLSCRHGDGCRKLQVEGRTREWGVPALVAPHGCSTDRGTWRRSRVSVSCARPEVGFSVSKGHCQWLLFLSNWNYVKSLEGKGHPGRGAAVIQLEWEMLIFFQMRSHCGVLKPELYLILKLNLKAPSEGGSAVRSRVLNQGG